MKDFKQSLVKGFAWQASTKLFLQIFSWISTVWVARLLVPEDYGLVAVSGIVTGLFLLLATTGLAAGVVNRSEITKEELDTVFWLSLIIGGGLYAGVFWVAEPASRYYELEELTDLIRVAGLMVLISSARLIPNAIALRKLDYKVISLNEMFGGFIGIIVTLSMAFMGFQYWSLVMGTIVAELFMTFVFFVYYRYVPGFAFSMSKVIDLLRFGSTLLSSRALMFVSTKMPIFLLSTYTNTKITGHYQMAHTFASLPSTKVGLLFSNLIFPAMSRIKGDKNLAKTTFIQMHTSLIFITAPMFVGLALVSEPLIKVVLTEAWSPIITPFQVICVIAVLQLSSLFITRAVEGLGEADVSLKHQIYTIIICGPAMWFGVYKWGLDGLLLGWLASSPVLYAYLLHKIAIRLGITYLELIRMFFPTAVCLLFMSVSVFVLLEFVISDWGHLEKLILACLCGAFVFSAASFLFARDYLEKVKRIVFKDLKEEKHQIE